MRRGLTGLVVLSLVVAGLALHQIQRSEPDPKDLSAWIPRARSADWSQKASAGDAEAQFLVGLNLVRTNLLQMVDRVPSLSAIPVVGKRFFQTVSYGLDNAISPEQLEQAHDWIKKSADQGFPPAKYAAQLFVGRVSQAHLPNAGLSTE